MVQVETKASAGTVSALSLQGEGGGEGVPKRNGFQAGADFVRDGFSRESDQSRTKSAPTQVGKTVLRCRMPSIFPLNGPAP